MVTQAKKELILEILKSGRYKVVGGELHSRKGPLAGNVLPSGYKQHTIFNGIRNGKGLKCIAYAHVIIYLATYGMYPEGEQIDHKDRDVSNNHPDNLEAVPPVINAWNTKPHSERQYGEWRKIRKNEIADIRRLHAQGLSQSAIARELDLNRLSVRYIIKNIEAGKELKYENWSQNFLERCVSGMNT